jgi:hypothetical protein
VTARAQHFLFRQNHVPVAERLAQVDGFGEFRSTNCGCMPRWIGCRRSPAREAAGVVPMSEEEIQAEIYAAREAG